MADGVPFVTNGAYNTTVNEKDMSKLRDIKKNTQAIDIEAKKHHIKPTLTYPTELLLLLVGEFESTASASNFWKR